MENKYRPAECTRCGHKFTARVELSATTQNLSGEKTIWCPKCHAACYAGPIIQPADQETKNSSQAV